LWRASSVSTQIQRHQVLEGLLPPFASSLSLLYTSLRFFHKHNQVSQTLPVAVGVSFHLDFNDSILGLALLVQKFRCGRVTCHGHVKGRNTDSRALLHRNPLPRKSCLAKNSSSSPVRFQTPPPSIVGFTMLTYTLSKSRWNRIRCLRRHPRIPLSRLQSPSHLSLSRQGRQMELLPFLRQQHL